MSRRLFDFNLDNNNMKSANANRITNKASCNVYINAKPKHGVIPSTFGTADAVQIPQDPYPTIGENDVGDLNISPYADLRTRDMNIQAAEDKGEHINADFYRVLAISLVNILKDNNVKLLANIIDQSGKIIVDGIALCQFISLLCKVDATKVNLKYEDKEEGCTLKINPIKKVKKIEVNGQDMNICYNKEYNSLQNEFNICLERVIIGFSYV